ncbi:threonine dehydratase [Blattabacterium sp. (Periplaneta americana) str. BPLAN]|uniref:threonine ammonia-lyase n=1 Tax=Blattabacterium sp. (Periplaneta americana) TaxID=367488 RepID=UPI0001BA0B50|nr:threonine ammonia-lyase [Blattabacterium sp. (Periplaneta americana)]ACX83722.1 threonine dehydratase [Blattabacterium sp. (Periplaneta americana) str. BPLAN]
MKNKFYFPSYEEVVKAKNLLKDIIYETPLQRNSLLSEKYQANIFLKREDLQIIRSYKIRGAYNKIKSLSHIEELKKGIVCASAGNHAQGVAYSCNILQLPGKIYMPSTTPKQKVERVKMFGKENVEIVLIGDTFDAVSYEAMKDCKKNKKIFIHPFDDIKIIEGQATVGLEILKQSNDHSIDYVFLPIGGGGLASGVGSIFKQFSPKTKIIGVEPQGAPSMSYSLKKGKVIELKTIDRFIDGASVKKVGELNFNICNRVLSEIKTVPEGKVCTTILDLYNLEAIVAEPAGALSISALDFYSKKIKGKTIVCVLSGGNNDITRTEEIRERSLLYEEKKHYFIVKFPQRAGSLKEFVNNILGPKDDIAYFEYSKKNSKEEGPAIIGIELADKNEFSGLLGRMKKYKVHFQYLNKDPDLFRVLI